MSDNPLIDSGAKTSLNDYSVVGRSSDGSLKLSSPVMPGPGATKDSPHWLSGIPVLDSEQSFLTDIQNNDKFSAVFDAAATAMDAFGVGFQAGTDLATLNVGGLIGNLVAAPITAWIIDHVKPIRLVMDELIGNPTTITGISATWSNMSQSLATATNDLKKAAAGTSGYWQGQAADAYRDGRAAKLAGSLGTAALLCEAWSMLLAVVSDCVKIVHDTVRDLIAALVALLVEIAVNCIAEGPEAAVAEFAAEAPSDLTRVITIVGKLLTKVLEGAFEGCGLAAKILAAITELAKVAKDLVDVGTQQSVPTSS